MDREVHDLRVEHGREAAQGVRNVVNPMAGCGVQQTRGQSNGRVFGSGRLRRKPLEPGGTAGAERARDVAVPGRSPGDGLDGSGRSDVMSAEGRSMNPKRGVRCVGASLRVGCDGPDRANRYASEQERCRCLDPMRSIHDSGGKGQRTTLHGVPATTRHCLDLGCEIALERRHFNLERSWVSVRSPTPGS
jgi:hypothetical protein